MVIKEIDARLRQWGDYMRDHNELGYPSASVEYRMKQGSLGKQSRTANTGFVPADIERTEAAVLTLPHDLQAAVTVAYTTGGGRDQQARRLAKRLGTTTVSRHKLNKMIDYSHMRIAGVLDGMAMTRRRRW